MTSFHEELRAGFYRDVGYGAEARREFEATRHRVFFGRTLERLLDCAGGALALGIDEIAKGGIVARFQDSVLVDGKHQLKDKGAQLARQLAAAFPGASFQLEFEEVKR